MTIKMIISSILVALIMVSCSPMATPLPPTEMIIPTSTPIPSPVQTPTVVPTPAPENLANAKDLSLWVGEFVHAYGGTVMVNGNSMDADQLLDAILSNPVQYVQTRKIKGDEALFLMVNDVPLAMMMNTGKWGEATMARLSELAGVAFEFGRSGPQDHAFENQYSQVLEKVAGEGSTFIFPSEMDTCRIFNTFSTSDWKKIVTDWDTIQNDLDQGKIPTGYPYEWQGVYKIINYARQHVKNPQFRASHLVELRMPASYCLLADSIVHAQQELHLSHDEMRKILEFVVRTRVIKFPEVTKWDVEDEMITANVVAKTGGGNYAIFWNTTTGLEPVEISALVASWIKKDHPDAKTYVMEDLIFENKYDWAQMPIIDFDKFIKSLHEKQAQIDGVIVENNFWIYAPPELDYISQKIDDFKVLGFEIGGAETMVITGDQTINDPNRKKTTAVKDRNLAQAYLYRELLSLYLSKGIDIFGFGGIDDYNAWTNDTGLPDANPLLFDDEFHAKPAYYAIVRVLYEHLP